MPDSKPISDLVTAEQITQNDLIETAIPAPSGVTSETGYVSRKVSLSSLATWIGNTFLFSSALQTTTKTIVGAINELLGLIGKRESGTLTAGNTSLVLTNSAIVATSLINVYAPVWYSNMVIDGNNHTCTLTFPAQSSDIDVTIKIS